MKAYDSIKTAVLDMTEGTFTPAAQFERNSVLTRCRFCSVSLYDVFMLADGNRGGFYYKVSETSAVSIDQQIVDISASVDCTVVGRLNFR